MKSFILRKSIIVLIILAPFFIDLGCKKQPKCGCGKDVMLSLTNSVVSVYYTESSKTAYFISAYYSGSYFYFCNPGKWMDLLKTFPSGKELLVTGSCFYECNYLMNAGNYGYYIPPTYQVDVTDVKENNYGKK